MLIALAQTVSRDLDVEANVDRHVRAVATAAAAGARVVLFPELSLTGYLPAAVAGDASLVLTPADPRLLPLREECRRRAVTAVVGAPTACDRERHLSAVVVDGRGAVGLYDKRNLFGAERAAFTPGRGAHVLDVDGRRLALGVCADLGDDAQAVEAGGADAWLLGVLLSPQGYRADADRAAEVARRYRVPVVLANHAGPTGGWAGAGGSGSWWPGGEAVVAGPGPGVFLVDLDDPSPVLQVG
ncbi:carbon-nitrogen hydrolase family protein [Kineococcus sp. SYSU DK002]|uniref:carbon-nitrogen hydrolase family protein n=1 Tax=Kineococcus sp. SYSU DK002 TaxID=3383123 RepID=UPI003D7DB3A0